MYKLLICLPWCIPLAFYEGDNYGTAFLLFLGAAIGATITGELLGVSFDED